MPFPVAHGLVGSSVAAALSKPTGSSEWRLLLIGAFLGICPDFDYVLNWLRVSGGGWHHGFTHSIFFALCIGLTMTLVWGERKIHRLILFTAATASHPLLDYLMTESRGVALWWPLTNHRYKLMLPNPIDYNWSGATMWRALADVLTISLMELAIFGPILLSVILIKKFVVGRRISIRGNNVT